MGSKANARSNTNATGDAARVESSNGPTVHHLFQIKRKSKNCCIQEEARHLQLSDVSPHFGRCLPDATKELGMSATSLKKACRFFGLPRWPGHKVRALESAMDGVERAMVGERADAGLSSAIPKLQQELDQLYHGTPHQINEKVESRGSQIAKSVYKRLYYAQDWRSYHQFSRRRLNNHAGNQPHEAQHGSAVLTPKTENIGEEGTRVVKVQEEDEWDSADEPTYKLFPFCTKCGLRIMQPGDVFGPSLV